MKRRRIFLSEEQLIIFFSRSRQISFDKFTVIWFPLPKLHISYIKHIKII